MGTTATERTKTMSEWKKPWVYNPRVATERIEELEEKVRQLKMENTDLKCELHSVESKYDTATNIINIQQDIISNYGNVFKLQEAELIKLRNEVCDNARNTNDSKETM